MSLRQSLILPLPPGNIALEKEAWEHNILCPCQRPTVYFIMVEDFRSLAGKKSAEPSISHPYVIGDLGVRILYTIQSRLPQDRFRRRCPAI
jgi:hypothetical protein